MTDMKPPPDSQSSALGLESPLGSALAHPVWMAHRIGDTYCVKNAGKIGDDGWKMAYYPIFLESGEPRALMEKAIYEEKVEFIAGKEFCKFKVEAGTDFREVPLRFVSKENI